MIGSCDSTCDIRVEISSDVLNGDDELTDIVFKMLDVYIKELKKRHIKISGTATLSRIEKSHVRNKE